MTDETTNTAQQPDAKWHRQRDGDYMSGLVRRTKMSLNKVAAQLGVGSRWLRYVVEGREDFPYSVQYALEVLANSSAAAAATQVREPQGFYDARQAMHSSTVLKWFDVDTRPVRDDDNGKRIVARDASAVQFQGIIVRDDFGLSIREDGTDLDSHSIPLARVKEYALMEEGAQPTRYVSLAIKCWWDEKDRSIHVTAGSDDRDLHTTFSSSKEGERWHRSMFTWLAKRLAEENKPAPRMISDDRIAHSMDEQ